MRKFVKPHYVNLSPTKSKQKILFIYKMEIKLWVCESQLSRILLSILRLAPELEIILLNVLWEQFIAWKCACSGLLVTSFLHVKLNVYKTYSEKKRRLYQILILICSMVSITPWDQGSSWPSIWCLGKPTHSILVTLLISSSGFEKSAFKHLFWTELVLMILSIDVIR